MTRHTPPPLLDIATLAPEFAARARETVRLHPRRGDAPSHCSKIGGSILWPADEPWPHCEIHESPLVTVLQLFADDVPELGFPSARNVFQLLWCPNRHRNVEPLDNPTPHVYWRDSAAVTSVLADAPPARVMENRYCPDACVLHLERVVEYPDVTELPEDLVAEMNDRADVQDAIQKYGQGGDLAGMYQSWLSVASGWKVGGFPHWVQDPKTPVCACGREMKHLLTIASGEFDGGTWHRWLAEEERDVWGAPYEQRWAVQGAPDIMIGDMGTMNVFICRMCTAWPIAAVCQGC